MKKIKKISVFLLMLMLCLVTSVPIMAATASAEQDGLKVSLTTDKEEYSDGEQILLTLTVENTNKEAVTDLKLEKVISDGYELTEESIQKLKELVELGAGQEITLSLKAVKAEEIKKDDNLQEDVKKDDNLQEDDKKNDNLQNGDSQKTEEKETGKETAGVNAPETDDENNVIVWSIVCFAALVGIVIVQAVKGKKGKNALFLLLCTSLVASSLVSAAAPVSAADAERKSITIEKTVKYNGEDATFKIEISYVYEEKTDEDVSEEVTVDPSSPYGKYGNLQLCSIDHDGDASTPERKQLCDENGKPVQLKGMSTFGLQWSDGFWVLNESAFDALAYDWECDIIRLAMYVTEDGYASNPGEILARVEKGIELATERGMYVLVDWHMLSPGDPTNDIYLNAGMELAAEGQPFYEIAQAHPDYNGPQLFFAYMAEKYGDQGNVLFELANEPNGLSTEADANEVWSNKLKPYFENVLAAVRDNDADTTDNIVICGTDNWSQFVNAPASDPIDDDSVMYTVHFYAGTHDAGYDEEEQYWLRAKIDEALAKGLAVFCTEWGTSESTGDGGPYIDFSERWLNYFEENQISWCSWSLAKKDEVSASCTSNTLSEPTDLDGDGIPEWDSDTLSITGNYVRAKIRGEEAPLYVESTTTLDFENNPTNYSVNGDSPNQNIVFEQVTVQDNALKISNATGTNIWDNRIVFSDLGTTYGIYRDLTFDLIVKDEDVEAANITIKPIIQSEATSWWGDAIEQQTFTKDNFISMGNGYSYCTATFPMEALSPTPTDTLGHVLLLLATDTCESIYIDNIGFSSCTNGDIKYKAKLPDNPGTYISMPFTFDSETREGWVTEGTSKLDYEDFTVGLAETTAMKFPVGFDGTNNAWEDGARISSPYFPAEEMTLEKSKNIKTIEFDVYLEPEHATKGELVVHVCPIPNGAGYWYQAGTGTMDPINGGETITNSEGTTLLKYHVSIPFSADGNYPYSDEVPVRNLVLAFASNESDYNGYIYCDNVEFVE